MTLYLIVVSIVFALSAGSNLISYRNNDYDMPLTPKLYLTRSITRMCLAIWGIAVLASSM